MHAGYVRALRNPSGQAPKECIAGYLNIKRVKFRRQTRGDYAGGQVPGHMYMHMPCISGVELKHVAVSDEKEN